jgi:hypothetical protein
MVALMTDVEDQPTGIHLTFLARDGSGKAPIEKDKQRRTKGLIKGSAMRLTSGEGRLLIGEGIETTLSVYVGTGRPAWAVGGAKNLAACSLPPDISEITLLVDGDDQGRISAADAASIWRREGRSVILAEAPEGKDFNDLLMEGE